MKVYRGRPPHEPGCVTVRTSAAGPAPFLPMPKRFSIYELEGPWWGAESAAAAQLALWLLLDVCRYPNAAVLRHIQFRDEVLARLPSAGPWKMTEGEIQAWVRELR